MLASPGWGAAHNFVYLFIRKSLVVVALMHTGGINFLNTPNDYQERRLATILAVDIVGYSRLMDADEAGTYAALRAARPPRLMKWRKRWESQFA